MKRFLFVFFVLVPFLNIYSQAATFDSALNLLMGITHVDQMIYYDQQLADNIAQIDNLVKQVEHMKEQAERTVQNLASAKDIKDWDDFMDFYNRQLYLER